MDKNKKIKFAFFGSSRLSAIVLDELERAGFVPTCIVTTPDKPKGRKLAIAPNIVKDWATRKDIPVYDPPKLDHDFIEKLKAEHCDLFVVASYGKIIPQAVIDLPAHKILNIHPSLLPKYRGPSPLPSAMLDDEKKTGVTIIRLDAEMDHGPIVAHEEVVVDAWPTYEDFEEMMARRGARLLARILPDWVGGKIKEVEQDHSKATYTKKIVKEDGLIDVVDLASNTPRERAYAAFRKIQAFHAWPQVYFFVERGGRADRQTGNEQSKKVRVKITGASFDEKAAPGHSGLIIEKVIPEGKKEMSYQDFLRGQRS